MRQGHTENHWNDANGNPAGGCTFGVGFAISWQNGPLGRHVLGQIVDWTAGPGGPRIVRESENPNDPTGCSDAGCHPNCTRRQPNGAFVEDVIQAVIGRIEFYQSSRFASADNAEALEHLRAAAEALDRRTKDREARKVEGTHVA